MKRNFLLNPILEMDTISFNDSVAEKFKKVGNNTGNMVFVNAVKEQIEFEKEDWLRPDMDFSDQYTYVLPCSNFLHESNKWLEPLASLIENQPIKIILIGLGAQAKLNEVPRDVVAKLSAEQIKFFKIVAERCKNLGVRGEFTAECLNILGIKNSKVIGCPSIYKYLDGQFPRLDEPSFDNAVVTITPSNGILSTNLLNLAIEKQMSWIMQSKEELVSMYSSNALVRKLQKEWRFPTSSWNGLKRYQENKAKIFWSFEEWNNYLACGKYTFAFGTRFHGNMMALRNLILNYS